MMSRMVVVILLCLHKGIHNALVIILIDKDGVDSAGQLELVLKSHDVQLLGGKAALAHGSDVVGVQAVAHAEHSVHGVAGLHAGDELGGLLHHIDFGLGVGAGGQFDALHEGAEGLCAVALDKVVHLGQHDLHIVELFGLDAAADHIGQLEGLVFCGLDLSHDFIPPVLGFIACNRQ